MGERAMVTRSKGMWSRGGPTCRNKSAFITTFYIQNLKFASFITTCLDKMKEILAFILPARGQLASIVSRLADSLCENSP